MSGTTNPENDNPAPESQRTAQPGAEQAAGEAAPAATAAGEAPASLDVQLAALAAERDDFKDRYLRAYAEAENIRKRAEREKLDTSKYAIASFAREVLSVGDNLRRAMSASSTAGEERSPALEALIQGVELTEQELRKILERNGIRLIDAEGQPFDPNFHQAVMEREDKAVAAGTVLQVFQEGYRIEDRVLRPAMVVVSKGGFKAVKTTAAAEAAASPAGSGDTETGSDQAAGNSKPDEKPGAA